ncbi:MAG TPA: inorganic phosphate transporter [bacterium]|nr:inorganic phosphate transporter [bacterium]HQL63743.1 inorganic phosphate transporter [bacterium]
MEPTLFMYSAGIIAVAMLVWDTIEVGRNDAANIVNAVFGARVLRRRTAVYIAGVAVILGACAASPVMETARKGIFDPEQLSLRDALSVYLGVYLTDTVLLYSFSAFGMPVSTTAGLVFSLLGGGLALGGIGAVHWGKTSEVITAIIFSILITGLAGFAVQRVFRTVIGQDCENPKQVYKHGAWIAGFLLTGLVYFILMKGMKNVAFINTVRTNTFDVWGAPLVLIVLWTVFTVVVEAILLIGKDRAARRLFSGLAIVGMLAIAFAFGQNDLCNSTSPGLASWLILRHGEIAHQIPVPTWLLFSCGILLFLGMTTQNAQRVTRAEVNTGSQGDVVRLYAPAWCITLAKLIMPHKDDHKVLAPEPHLTENHKLQHYDSLRAAVITSISGSTIAFASGLGLPVSTTYVAFAAVVASGYADRIFLRGDAHLKLGRTIWVICGWLLSACIAALATATFAKTISLAGTVGIALCLAVNLTVRHRMKKRADAQEERLIREAAERKKAVLGERFQTLSATDHDDERM